MWCLIIFLILALKMCKICLKRTLDATFLDCLALTFCDVIGELLPEWACLTLQGGTTFLLMSKLADIPVSRVRNSCLKSEKRESYPSVHDLQSTTRLAESWISQIMDTRMGIPCPFRSVVIDYFSPTPLFSINNPILMSFSCSKHNVMTPLRMATSRQ